VRDVMEIAPHRGEGRRTPHSGDAPRHDDADRTTDAPGSRRRGRI
jgi:hypothetical protein